MGEEHLTIEWHELKANRRAGNGVDLVLIHELEGMGYDDRGVPKV